jgi:hypothetical protein
VPNAALLMVFLDISSGVGGALGGGGGSLAQPAKLPAISRHASHCCPEKRCAGTGLKPAFFMCYPPRLDDEILPDTI